MLNQIILLYIKANPELMQQGLSKDALEDKILTYITQTECKLLEIFDYNLMPYSSQGILSDLLCLSNADFDFQPLVTLVTD